MKRLTLGLFAALALVPFFSVSAEPMPDCLSAPDGTNIPVDNQQVLTWEATTPNQYLARAHVQGTLLKVLPDQTGHKHFLIQIGASIDQMLEVIYDKEFGKLPTLSPGMDVEACGDYITSNAQAGQYPPSPAGAIIHWIHITDEPTKHPSGFTAINGVVYGQELNAQH